MAGARRSPAHHVLHQAPGGIPAGGGRGCRRVSLQGAGKPWNYVKAWLGVRRRVARGAYDLVHAQFGQSGLLAFPKRLPLVITFRGDDLQGIEDARGRLTLGGRLLKLACQAMARHAETTIVVSEHMRQLLHPSVPTRVIPSGLDLSLFRPIPRDEARQRLGLPLDRRLVLFAGDPALARKRFALARAAVGDVPARLGGIAGCELCPDDRPETIAAALERVLRRRQRIAGHEAVRDLDEAKLTQEVIAIYRSVVARRDSGRVVVEAPDAVS